MSDEAPTPPTDLMRKRALLASMDRDVAPDGVALDRHQFAYDMLRRKVASLEAAREAAGEPYVELEVQEVAEAAEHVDRYVAELRDEAEGSWSDAKVARTALHQLLPQPLPPEGWEHPDPIYVLISAVEEFAVYHSQKLLTDQLLSKVLDALPEASLDPVFEAWGNIDNCWTEPVFLDTSAEIEALQISIEPSRAARVLAAIRAALDADYRNI